MFFTDGNGPTSAASEKACTFTEDELARIERAKRASHTVVTTRPQSLGYVSIACIIINRMVGTGIFKSPTVLMQGTDSVGVSLIFWVLGALLAMAGVYVFAEFGLAVPRLHVEGQEEKECVPRNGGEKNYLEYLCKKPLFLATCLYGIPFIVFGSVAGNALVVAENAVRASGRDPSDAELRGIAIAVVTFSCLVHVMWRRGGLYLNNFFGLVKIAILLMLFIVGVASAAGAIRADGKGSEAVAKANFNPETSFKDRAAGSNGYAEAFLAIIFAYGGFNQANYVLGEIDDPRRKFKPAGFLTVGFVSFFYILINITYMLVVPKSEQNQATSDVAISFFERVFGHAAASQVFYGLMAFSSLGNVIVQTFTAARVKQEIAKEGILPWSTFFANNYDLRPFRTKRQSHSGSPASGGETPAGGFLLHWVFATLLILVTIPLRPSDAYSTLVSIYAFIIDAVFGFLVGAGLLYLRLNNSRTHWSHKSTSLPWLSTCAALIFTLGNFFPLIGIWVPPSSETSSSSVIPTVDWFVTGTVGTAIVFVGFLWWLGLAFVLPRIRGMHLEVDREEVLDNSHGYWIMWHEIVSFRWVVK